MTDAEPDAGGAPRTPPETAAGLGGARSIATSAGIVAAAFLVSRLLGMVREVVIAARFGTGDSYDAYLAAFRIPDLLFVLVMSGAFGSAFIPVFGGFLARDQPELAWRLANTLLTYVVVIFVVVAQAILLFAEPLVGTLIAPDLPDESRALAVRLTRLLLLSPLLLGLGAAGKGMLEAQRSFTLPAVAPILYNLGIIAGAAVLAPSLGAYGLALGVIGGAAGHVAIQFAALARRGVRFRPSLSRDTAGLGEVARLLGPRIAGQAASQANLIVMTNFASGLGTGSIAALSYANHVILLPHGFLAMSISTVVFPTLAHQFELGQVGEIRRTVGRVLSPLLFLTIPAAVVLVVCRESIVQVVFQYGSFSPKSTAIVAGAVGYLAVGLVARSILEPIIRTFYAMHDTKTPLAFSLATIALNIALSWVLAGRMGVDGLALSLSITYSLKAVGMLAALSRKTDGGLFPQLLPSLIRILASSAVLAALLFPIEGRLRTITDPTAGRPPWAYAVFALALAGAGLAYLAVANALRVPELAHLRRTARRRLGRA